MKPQQPALSPAMQAWVEDLKRVFPVKCYYPDLLKGGVVTSRFDLDGKVKSGRLSKPNKTTSAQQSTAWWWGSTIIEDLVRERLEMEAAAALEAEPAKARRPRKASAAAAEDRA